MHQQKRIKEIDRLMGDGTLEAPDGKALRARYDLHILRETIEAGSGGEPELLDIQGHVEPDPPSTFLDPGSEFTLTLSDGGTLDIMIVGTGFNSFDIAIRDARDFSRRYPK